MFDAPHRCKQIVFHRELISLIRGDDPFIKREIFEVQLHRHAFLRNPQRSEIVPGPFEVFREREDGLPRIRIVRRIVVDVRLYGNDA